MRLLVVSTWLPVPPDNGSRLRAYHLLRHLSARHELTLLTFGTVTEAGQLDELRASCARLEAVPETRLRRGRLDLRGLLSPLPRFFIQTDSPRMRALVAEAIRGQDAAIGLQLPAATYLAAQRHVARVFEEAEVAVLRERCLREPNVLRRLRHEATWLKHRRLVRETVAAMERTTVVSPNEREHLRAIGCPAERVAVVPNGVDPAPWAPPPHRAPRLVYAGSVTYSANLDAVRHFVRAIWPLIRRDRPDVTFSVTGAIDGVDVSDLAAAEGVTFTGRLPEVDTLIRESAVAVVPLRVGGGTRLKVLQAMARGTPVVSTAKGVEGLEIDAGTHALVADAPETFAGHVLALLRDPSAGEALARRAWQLVAAKYAWGPIAAGLEMVIDEAVRDRAARGRRERLT